ncbi:MAG: hypothetical protein ACRC5G_06435 [Cetobacterium sp.]
MESRQNYSSFKSYTKNDEIINGLFFKMKLDEATVGNKIQFSSKNRVISGGIKYTDNYGYEITKSAKEVIQNGDIVTLVFDYFYLKDYELEVNGYNIYEHGISEIEIEKIDQTKFKESKDTPHGHLLNNSIMTIESNLSHEENFVLKNALNSDVHSIFQSQPYTSVGYGDIIIKMSTICLVDHFKFMSTIYTTKVLNNYTLSYRTSENEEWKEFITEVNNQSQSRLHIFKPILATELRLRVTRSTDNKIFLAEFGITKYSTIRTDIMELFTSPALSRLNGDVTKERIISLKERVIFTEDYMRMLDKASDLFIDREFIEPKILKLNLNGATLVNHIAFTNSRDILKGVIKYKDLVGNICTRRLFWYPEDITNGVIRIGGENPIIGKMRVLSEEIELLIYGDNNVELIEFKTLPLDGAFLTDEKDAEIEVQKCYMEGTFVEPLLVLYPDTPIHGWCPPCIPGGAPRPSIDPIENCLLRLGDKDNNLFYRSKNFSSAGYADIRVFLQKEMFVGQIDILSFFENSTGHVNKFEILAEDIAASRLSWDENAHERELVSLGFGERNGITNQYMIKKLKPFYTNKIVIRIHDAKDFKARINEIKIHQYVTLELDVENLFKDSSYRELKNGVNLEMIKSLESKTVIGGMFTERLEIAKNLLRNISIPSPSPEGESVTVQIPLTSMKAFNKIQISTDKTPDAVEVVYTDLLGIERRKKCEFVVQYFKNNSFIVINTPILCALKLNVVVHGVKSVTNMSTNEINPEMFLAQDEQNKKIDLNRTQLISTHGKFNNLNNLKDSSMTSYYTSDFFTDLGYTDIKIKFIAPLLVDSLKLLSYRSKSSGLVRQFKMFAKELLTGDLVELGDSGYTTAYSNNHRIIKAKGSYLTDEVIIRVVAAEDNWAIVNDLEIYKVVKK